MHDRARFLDTWRSLRERDARTCEYAEAQALLDGRGPQFELVSRTAERLAAKGGRR